MAKKKTLTLNYTVVGLEHRLTKQARRLLAGMVPFSVGLQREPHNIHDSNAISIVVAETSRMNSLLNMKVGYINRAAAADLAPRLDSGKVEVISALVTDLDAEEGDAELEVRLRKSA